MTSVRKLRRRALRWHRYVSHYTPPHDFFERPEIMEPPGYWRAYAVLGTQIHRRWLARQPLPWLDDEAPF